MPELDDNSIAMAQLTPKQREVLNLLIEHKTSKEMSRILGISPHTVDQRIDSARAKLGLASRGELALAWRKHLEIAGSPQVRMTYQSSGIGINASSGAADVPDDMDGRRVAVAGAEKHHARHDDLVDYRVGPELLDGRWGNLARLGAVFTIAALFLMVVLIGFGVFVSISQVFTA